MNGKRRYDTVGGIPRAILQTPDQYRDHVNGMRLSVATFYKFLAGQQVFDIPKEVSYLLLCHTSWNPIGNFSYHAKATEDGSNGYDSIRGSIDSDLLVFVWRFLSPHTAALIGSVTKTPK